MPFFTISNDDPSKLTPEQIAEEIDALKLELARIETQIAAKNAWAVVDRKDSVEHTEWLAKSRQFRRLLLVRYMQIRPIHRKHNQDKNKPKD